jgi:aldose 1-epimerase
MRFQIVSQSFGNLTDIILQDQLTGNRCVVTPELGGIVRQLSLRKGVSLYSILKVPGTPLALQKDDSSASALLFPFASRIPGGKYTFEDRVYQLSLNEDSFPNAIHGLVRDKQFEVVEKTADENAATLVLGYKLNGQLPGYPFEVNFSVQYKLAASGAFSLTYKAENLGSTPCPVMFGWHPYFQLGNEKADAWTIKIPSDTQVTLNDDLMPDGTTAFDGETPLAIYHTTLDACFIAKGGSKKVVTELNSKNQKLNLKITQEAGAGKFNYIVIYTPPTRDCIAIEPLTGNVNSFNNGEGLNILFPGNNLSGEITVELV